MISLETKRAYTEVNFILNILGESYSNKIPNKIKNVFKIEMDMEYIPLIDINKPIKEQNFKKETIVIISALNILYWCESDAEKKRIQKRYKENGIRHQEELLEKYNPNKMFEKKNIDTDYIENNKETALTNIEEISLLKKVLNKIRRLILRE